MSSELTVTMPMSRYRSMEKRIHEAEMFRMEIIKCFDFSLHNENNNLPVMVKKDIWAILKPLARAQLMSDRDFLLSLEE